MKTFLVIAAAGGALALGVPAALAVTDSAQTRTIQLQSPTPAPQERPDRDDCPEEDGGAAQADGAATPGAEL